MKWVTSTSKHFFIVKITQNAHFLKKKICKTWDFLAPSVHSSDKFYTDAVFDSWQSTKADVEPVFVSIMASWHE